MANFIRHFDNVLENLEVTGKKVRHFDNDPIPRDRTDVTSFLTYYDVPYVALIIYYSMIYSVKMMMVALTVF